MTSRLTLPVGGRSLDFGFIGGTRGRPYTFGEGDVSFPVEIADFYMVTVPTTQSVWEAVVGQNPSVVKGEKRPVENVSWRDVAGPGGFLDRLNAGPARSAAPAAHRFRLPSEAEWEYAARGGPHWRGGVRFSGGHEIDAVAWYKDNSGDAMHDVGLKAPNQLGLYDLSGNAWEWCEDVHTTDLGAIPRDGTPYRGPGGDRVLRGGCFHNWAIHCTVCKRYEIGEKFHDGCIGSRLVLAAT